ncbi:hypothetical protein [Parasitella parasitica]|uniref:Enoyl reductase (ER) domain-containing protein n=1 Tax=Parasitella parasitica TaxID=35722 RepID=A0A0B7NM24_9FUNG|nr:hypothetical protein [Parasitella parasitica]
MFSAICLSNSQPSSPNFKFGLELKQFPEIKPKSNETTIQVLAASLNHRDVYIMKDQFMGVTTGGIIWSDAVGLVTQCGDNSFQSGDRVLINPGRGWINDAEGPENPFSMLGLNPCTGVAAEKVLVETDEVFRCPDHLSDEEAAALPLAGLTAYRLNSAVFSKCGVKQGDNVLVTGIGGGVALFALQFAVAAGANVYVTSSSSEKINKAITMGAKGGVNYKNKGCIEQLKQLLNGGLIRAVIDGAGGALYGQYPSVMKQGGIIANYGQTSNEPITFSMYQVAQNIELRGSTMGSRCEFKNMIKFVDKYKIKPVVSMVFKGLSVDSVQKAVNLMESSSQFGKIVLVVG